MGRFNVSVLWLLLATFTACMSQTTYSPTAMTNGTTYSPTAMMNDTTYSPNAMINDTTPSPTALNTLSDPNNDLLVDAYKNLRTILSNKLDDNYPIPPKIYSPFSNIYASFEPLQIITLDEVLQSISISSAITLSWRDPSIKWIPTDFEGIQTIKIASSLIWLPNILIPESAVEDGILAIPEDVDVSYKGLVTVLIPTITTTLCNLDLTYFPFDAQNCTLAMIETELYNMTAIKVSLGDMSKYFGTNAAWRLISHNCTQQLSFDTDTPVSYVSCHVGISRRSAFYVINLIGPMGMTSLMTLLAFCVPAEGGEKVSFIVSMFMSTSVFYNYIINITPRSMEHLPRLNILLVAIAVQIIFATAAIVFVLIRFTTNKRLQQQKDRRQLLGIDTPKDNTHTAEDETVENARKQGHESNINIPQSMSKKARCTEDGLKKRSGRSTPNEAEVKDNIDAHLLLEVKKSRSLTCDQLDMLFFCAMSLLTILLYVCIFAL